MLAAGELGDLPPGVVGHADQIHGGARRLAGGAAHRAQPAERPVQPHRHQIEGAHRVVPVDALALRDVGHQAPLLAVGLAVDAHRAGHARHQVEDPFQQRALAGAVGSDDTGDHAVGGRQIDVPQHRPPPVGDGEVAHHQRAVRGVGRRRARTGSRRRLAVVAATLWAGAAVRVDANAARCRPVAGPASLAAHRRQSRRHTAAVSCRRPCRLRRPRHGDATACDNFPWKPRSGAAPPRARATVVMLWSSMPT